MQDFAGTILLVSHDRTFLNNVVTQVFAFEGDAVVREYAGGYDDWLMQRESMAAVVAKAEAAANASRPVTPAAAARKSKMSFNEVRELESLPGKIEALEKEQAVIQQRLADPAIYTNGTPEVKNLTQRQEAIAAELEAAMVRWEELELKKAAI